MKILKASQRSAAVVNPRPAAHRWLAGKLIIAAAAILGLQAPSTEACYACNLSFADEVLAERADTLIGRDIRQAMANQQGLPLDETTEVSGGHRAEMEEKAAASLTCADCCPETDNGKKAAKSAEADTQNAETAKNTATSSDTLLASLATADNPIANGVNVTPSPRFIQAAQDGNNAENNERQNTNVLSPLSEEYADLYEDEDFIDIIRRDEGLSIPPTSYVPQDIEPDVEFTIELSEGMVYLGNGVIYDGFVTNGKIPGPTLRVTQGDIVKFTVENTGTVPHGASIHAANTQTSKYVGQIPAGGSKSVTFRATQPGVFMYHCAPGGHAIPMHVQFGQYGMIVVEPAETKFKLEEELGREPDVTMHIVQHGIYASGRDAIDGAPLYSLFNGRIFRYVEEPIEVRPGDYVRIYFLNIGPNELSTFHFVGIIWDYVYWQGHPDAWMPGGQTITAGPSDSWVIEFRVPPDEGAYTMLTHGVGESSRGAIGLLVADRDADTPVEIMADGPEYSQEELEAMKEEATRVVSPYRPASGPGDEIVYYGPETEEVTISIIGNSYSPKVAQVAPGTKVTWVNEDVFSYMAGEFSGIHNAVAVGEPPERFASPLLAHGESYSFTFEQEGQYDYICTPHPYMEGIVIVSEDHPEHLDPEELTETRGIGSGGWAMVLAGVAVVISVASFVRKQ